MAETPKMIRDVSNALEILEATRGGRVACEAAEELLLLAVVTIEKTAGKERVRATLRSVSKEMA